MTDVADSSEEGSTFSEMGHLVALMSGPLETPCLVLDGARRFWVTYPKGLRSPSLRRKHCLRLHLEVELVHQMLFLSPREPLEMPDQSCAFLSAASVGTKAASLHP